MTKLFSVKLPAVLVFTALSLPVAAWAEEAPAEPAADSTPTAEPTQSDRMQLMRAMRARMHQMMTTQDPEARRELMEAQMKDMDAMLEMGGPPMPGTGMGAGMGMGMMRGGMGAGPMAMGPGSGQKCKPRMGGMMGAGKPCMTGKGGNCATGAALDQRLDALEKRMDLMQSMMEFMMRR